MLYKPLFFSAFAFSALIIPRILEKSTRIYKKLHFSGFLSGFPQPGQEKTGGILRVSRLNNDFPISCTIGLA
jgi:hypothetical protein